MPLIFTVILRHSCFHQIKFDFKLPLNCSIFCFVQSFPIMHCTFKSSRNRARILKIDLCPKMISARRYRSWKTHLNLQLLIKLHSHDLTWIVRCIFSVFTSRLNSRLPSPSRSGERERGRKREKEGESLAYSEGLRIKGSANPSCTWRT